MRKITKSKIALCMMFCCLAACTKDDPSDGYVQDPTDLLPPSEEIVQTAFTATLAARSEGKTWPLNARLTLQYEKADGSTELTLATIESVESDGSAKIAATLTDARDGSSLRFVYPATLVNEAGDDIDAALLADQLGTLEDIAKRFDAATGSTTLQTKAGELLRLEDRVSVSKFTPAVDGTPIEGILSLTVSDGTHSYTAAPAEGCFGTDGIYLAMLPVNNLALNCTATTATQTYNFLSEKLTLQVNVLFNDLPLSIHEPAVNPGTAPGTPQEPTPGTPQEPAPGTPQEPAPGTPQEPAPGTAPGTTPEPTPAAPPVTTLRFSSTLASKGQPQTKAVDADGKKNWVEGEQLNLCYEKTDGTFASVTARVDAVATDGSATFTAELTDARDGGTVKFVYPATLAGATGELDPSRLAAQHGTIADISAHFDASTGNSTLIIDGETCTTARVSMANRVFIGKFTPKLNGTPIAGITCLTISDGTHTYTVTPASGTFGTDGIYVAMLPLSAQQLTIIATTGSKNYSYVSSAPVTLSASKLYTSLSVPMAEKDFSRAGYPGYNI